MDELYTYVKWNFQNAENKYSLAFQERIPDEDESKYVFLAKNTKTNEYVVFKWFADREAALHEIHTGQDIAKKLVVPNVSPNVLPLIDYNVINIRDNAGMIPPDETPWTGLWKRVDRAISRNDPICFAIYKSPKLFTDLPYVLKDASQEELRNVIFQLVFTSASLQRIGVGNKGFHTGTMGMATYDEPNVDQEFQVDYNHTASVRFYKGRALKPVFIDISDERSPMYVSPDILNWAAKLESPATYALGLSIVDLVTGQKNAVIGPIVEFFRNFPTQILALGDAIDVNLYVNNQKFLQDHFIEYIDDVRNMVSQVVPNPSDNFVKFIACAMIAWIHLISPLQFDTVMREIPSFRLIEETWNMQDNEKFMDLVWRILKREPGWIYTREISGRLGQHGSDLLERLLHPNDAKRLTLAQALLHPYFQPLYRSKQTGRWSLENIPNQGNDPMYLSLARALKVMSLVQNKK